MAIVPRSAGVRHRPLRSPAVPDGLRCPGGGSRGPTPNERRNPTAAVRQSIGEAMQPFPTTDVRFAGASRYDQ